MTTVYIEGQSDAITRILKIVAGDHGYALTENAGAADILVTESPGGVMVERMGGRGVSTIAKPFDLTEFTDALLWARGQS